MNDNSPPSGDNIRKFKADPDLDQAKDTAYRVTSSELRSFIERIEKLQTEKAEVGDFEKVVFAEAKSRGYDVSTIRRIIALRKKEPGQISEEQAVLEFYMEALGM
ncbi:MAG: DUF2312 domain-containing protein [Rhodobacteraceae bacterium]|nr:DUF2312 domain-containing protein [Paracoccaceae bacterium]